MTGVPTCSWEGVEPEDEEREIFCDKPATAYIDDGEGHRHFACDEHVLDIRAKAGGGPVVRGAQHLKDEGHLRVSPESAVRWE